MRHKMKIISGAFAAAALLAVPAWAEFPNEPVRIVVPFAAGTTTDLVARQLGHLRTGVPCKDRVGMLNVLLAEGLNLGLSKMAGATNTHDYFQLSRLSRWHVESEAMARALDLRYEYN